MHPNSTCCRGHIFLLLGAACDHGRESCSPLPNWLLQVKPLFVSHFPEAIHVSPKFPMRNPYLSADGKPVVTLFTQIRSTQISSLWHSASSYGFLINALTDFSDFEGRIPKTQEEWRGRKRESLLAHSADSTGDVKYSLPFNQAGSTSWQTLLYPRKQIISFSLVPPQQQLLGLASFLHHPTLPTLEKPGLHGRMLLCLLLPLHPEEE